MKNLDLLRQKKTELLQQMKNALSSGDEKALTMAWEGLQDNLQETVLTEARNIKEQVDSGILVARGIRCLTSDEKAYYEQLAEAMRSAAPQQALSNMDVAMPKTTIDEVFKDLVAEHPLLSVINFQNTTGMVECILNTNTKQLATWGKLTDAVAKELSSGFRKMNLTLNKLSAWLPVAKSMLDLGPEWLDRYVRAILGESIAFGLEEAIINGTGKDMPIGMNRQVGDDVTVTAGVYPEKPTVKLTSFQPKEYGTFLAPLATDSNGNHRPIAEVIFICNPTDYLTKVMPATTLLSPNGTYIQNVTPVPTRFIQSVQVPAGKAIVGLGDRYFMALGASKDGRIEYSDENRFLEDERTYLIKTYGDGRPMDNKAFIYADITDLEPAVYLVETAKPDAILKELSIGNLTLSPEFDAMTQTYTAGTTAAKDKVTATAESSTATVTIKNGSTVVTNGGDATWSSGANTLTITVADKGITRTYTVTITKS